jgi:nicotinamidase-related amidase
MNRRTFVATGITLAVAPRAGAQPAQSPAAPVGASRDAPGVLPSADFPIVPRRTAFINVDLQNCFVEGYPVSAPGGLALLRRLNTFADVCRRAGILVVHTAHVLRPDGSNAGVLADYIPQIRDGMINRGAHTAALHKDLVIGPRDVVLEKPRFGAFQGTDLELILRSKDINHVIIGGIATNVCCETTAREATARDFRVSFLSDGTATFGFADNSADQMQRATCATLALFGEVLSLSRMEVKITAARA